jgi:hypothetical protein
VFLPPLGNQRTDGDNRVVDELGKLVAHLCAHSIVGLARNALGRCVPAQSGTVSVTQTMTLAVIFVLRVA